MFHFQACTHFELFQFSILVRFIWRVRVRSGLYLCLYLYRAFSCKLSIFLSRLIHEIEVEWFFDDITKFLICSWLSRVDADD